MARCVSLFVGITPESLSPPPTLCASPSGLPAAQVKFAINTETGEKVAVKILDKEKIQKQNMGAQIKKEARARRDPACFSAGVLRIESPGPPRPRPCRAAPPRADFDHEDGQAHEHCKAVRGARLAHENFHRACGREGGILPPVCAALRLSHRRRPPSAAQVLELIAGGELFDKIVAESRFDEKTARFYFRQLIKGVKCVPARTLFCRGGATIRAHPSLRLAAARLQRLATRRVSSFARVCCARPRAGTATAWACATAT